MIKTTLLNGMTNGTSLNVHLNEHNSLLITKIFGDIFVVSRIDTDSDRILNTTETEEEVYKTIMDDIDTELFNETSISCSYLQKIIDAGLLTLDQNENINFMEDKELSHQQKAYQLKMMVI